MLKGLFPESVIAEIAASWMWTADLPPEERVIIENAVPRRRRQFTAGRTCGRHLLARLGCDPGASIGRDRYGAPVWPEGIAGSISHTEDVCVVAAARQTPELRSLGVDVEKDTSLDPGLLDLVCDELEKATCRDAAIGDPYRLAKTIFSAKESVYKCVYPMLGTVLEFLDVHVELDHERRTFTATLNGPPRDSLPAAGCKGRVLYQRGHVYTGCVLAGL